MEQKEVKNPALITIGLFGTCGGSKWRAPFKDRYEREGIAFFDPQVENWDPSMAAIEADHLAEDEVILLPVTGETYGTASLAETGFSILQAIRLDDRRDFVIMIEQTLSPFLDNAVAAKESLRVRALVKKHLEKLRLSNLYLVDTLEDMLETSIELHRAAAIKKPLLHLNPHRRIEAGPNLP